MKRFEEIPHTADWSFRAFGRDRRELFENAAYAMFALEGAIPPPAAEKKVVREVQTKGMDWESLLVNWLSELLYLQETKRETYYDFSILRLEEASLEARVQGVRNGKIDKLIKAVTYHNLEIRETQEGWQATVVVDV